MTMFQPESAPAKAWVKLGAQVRDRVKPKAIVFVSAHWEGERDTILVTDQATNPLLFDYYGFPPEYCASPLVDRLWHAASRYSRLCSRLSRLLS